MFTIVLHLCISSLCIYTIVIPPPDFKRRPPSPSPSPYSMFLLTQKQILSQNTNLTLFWSCSQSRASARTCLARSSNSALVAASKPPNAGLDRFLPQPTQIKQLWESRDFSARSWRTSLRIKVPQRSIRTQPCVLT